jgi:cytoskeletal protein RodZ
MKAFNPSQVEQLKAIGTYLRQQREGKSLSLEEAAAQTFIRLPLLQALEVGEVERLPEPVYVRGFIRRYSELLQVDGESLLQELVQRQETEEEMKADLESAEQLFARPRGEPEPGEDIPPLGEIGEVPPSQPALPSRISLKTYLACLLLLAGIGAGAFYFLSRPPASQSPPSPPPASPATAPPPPSPTPQAATTPAAADSLSATITLDGSSWIQVEADGKTQFVGTLSQGTQKTWSAKKQLILQVGNAGAVNLSVNQAAPQRLGNPGEVKKVVLTPEEIGE